MTLGIRVDSKTREALDGIRINAMMVNPLRTIERMKSHIAKRPSVATAMALVTLDQAWLKVKWAKENGQ